MIKRFCGAYNEISITIARWLFPDGWLREWQHSVVYKITVSRYYAKAAIRAAAEAVSTFVSCALLNCHYNRWLGGTLISSWQSKRTAITAQSRLFNRSARYVPGRVLYYVSRYSIVVFAIRGKTTFATASDGGVYILHYKMQLHAGSLYPLSPV